MNRYKNFNSNITGIKEQLKFSITDKLNKFLNDDKQKVLRFDNSLTSNERKYIHNYCVQFSLNTKSFGFGDERYLTVSKKEDSNTKDSIQSTLYLKDESKQQILFLIKEISKYDINRDRFMTNANNSKINNHLSCKTGRLVRVEPNVPQIKFLKSGNYNELRQSLPIYGYKELIVNCIASNPVVIISGDTGCGKTTQVPQYLLEYCGLNNTKCRIVCAEPRRLAAISVSERICLERNESLGQTVGYQIRLESRVSNQTLLTFCTNGVILRTLMSNRTDFINNLTHIIIDEVHERDRFSDFLLLIMKSIVNNYPHIRLILMSATFNIKRFSEYFGNCPVIEIPGKLFDVKTYFLEDILKDINYMSLDMWHFKVRSDKQKNRSIKNNNKSVENSQTTDENSTKELDSEMKDKIDLHLKNAWVEGSDESFAELFSLLSSDLSLIDYKHSETGVTPLIVASGRNKLPIIEKLLEFGANLRISAQNKMRAIDWAKYFGHEEVVEFLESYCLENKIFFDDENVNLLTNEEKERLELYHNCFNDDEVDTHLICALLDYILNESIFGSILVFLPGFDDIIRLQESIITDRKRFDPQKYALFILHSQMQCSDQKRVFNRLSDSVRKIILSTNIAETSITIDDVVYVIDCGKVKEKSFDSLMGISSLKSVWISQSSVKQRRGRAGRTRNGVAYHLFSKNRFENMQSHQLPEILRMPIHELCLQTKLLVPNNDISIHEFLSSAMDPPSVTSVRTSVQLLRTIDALDSTEQLTTLGVRLLDLPIEPNFGKMILYSIVLKCIDPVLTIVSSLTYRDPFTIPLRNDLKKALKEIRNRFSLNAFSDHIIYLTAFNEWQKSGNKYSFCKQNLLSNTTMELISGIRQQLFNQLKSSGFVRDTHELNRNSENWCVIKAAICAGAYPKMIRFDQNRGQFLTQKDKIRFHQSSQLAFDPNSEKLIHNKTKLRETLPSDWLIYEEMVLIGRTSFAKCVTSISPITVALFSGPNCSTDDFSPESASSDGILQIDNWISFIVDPRIGKLVSFLREKLHQLFISRIDSFSKPKATDECVINAIINVLNVEELASGFQPIHGFNLMPNQSFRTDYFGPKYQTKQYFSERRFRNDRQKFKSNKNYEFNQ